mmetsp:Transcript_850/g.1851  ORF Transcript_850/g.1851 Transcript_850/m.1851 type:complete len:303 (-) Transcript_850:128-1036(-)
MAEVGLDKTLRLIDCPGIVFDDSDPSATALRNCVDPDLLEDPVGAVAALLARVKPEELMQLYALPRFPKGDAEAFLSLVARRLGKVKKGGVPDKPQAARTVLRDWNSGKVPYYTPPPKDDAHLVAGGATLVPQFSAGFDLAASSAAADAMVLENAHGPSLAVGALVSLAPAEVSADTTAAARGGLGAGMESSGEEEEEESMEECGESDQEEEGEQEEQSEEEEEAPKLAPKAAAKKKKAAARLAQEASSAAPPLDLAMGSADARRAQKALLKKKNKQSSKLAANMDEGGESEDEAYDFGVHY